MNDKQEILKELRAQILLMEGFKEPVLEEETRLGESMKLPKRRISFSCFA